MSMIEKCKEIKEMESTLEGMKTEFISLYKKYVKKVNREFYAKYMDSNLKNVVRSHYMDMYCPTNSSFDDIIDYEIRDNNTIEFEVGLQDWIADVYEDKWIVVVAIDDNDQYDVDLKILSDISDAVKKKKKEKVSIDIERLERLKNDLELKINSIKEDGE